MSSMPLDAAKQAKRYGRRFEVVHLGSSKKLVFAYLFLLIGVSFWPHGVIGYIAWTGMQLSMIYLVLAQRSHRMLQPWCPQCQGGYGYDEDVTAPDPVPQATA